jgi:predicted RND superfamily exporter protein
MKRQFFARYALLILMIVAFLMPFMYLGARRSLRSNKNDVKSWLPDAYEETTTYRWYRARFESDMFILASWEGCTLDSPALALLAKKLVPPDDPAQNPLTAPLPFFKKAVTGTDLVNLLVEKQGFSEEEAIERLKGFVVGPDGKQTCLVLTVAQDSEPAWEAERVKSNYRKPKFLHAVVERVYEVAEKECAIPRAAIRLGGPPVDNAAIDIEGERSLMRLAGFSGVVGLLMSWYCLRSWGLTVMVFTSAIFSAGLSLLAVWRFGYGDNMNAILLTMPSLVYVAATSAAIHLANYYRDTVRQSGFKGAPDRTVRAAWLPLALATGTTAIGLASMCITELVPIRMFGLYSAVGVVISFFIVILYVPSLLQYFPLRKMDRSADSARRWDPGTSPKWHGVGEWIIGRNGLVTAACLLVMVLGAWGVSKTQTSVKLMRLFSRDAQIIQDYKWLEDHLGPLVPMEVVLRVDKRIEGKSNLDLMSRMVLVGDVQRAIGALPDVGSTLAAPTFARAVPRRANAIERMAWKRQIEKHRDDLRDYLMVDQNPETGAEEELWRVSARVAALTDTDYGEFVNDIRAAVDPVVEAWREKIVIDDPALAAELGPSKGVTAVYTGLVPLIYKAQSSMLNGLILNFVGDLILIGVAMAFLVKNWSAGLLLMLPSLFPMAIVFGAMGWWGVVIDVGTVMVPAVALGVTVDDAIHFMLWVRHGQERGMTRPQAIMFAYQDCARAIYQSWGVIGLGLFSFALSSFTPTQRFGYLMFTMLTASSIGNLVLLPALLAGPAGNFFWNSGQRRLAAEPHLVPALPQPEPVGVLADGSADAAAVIPIPQRPRKVRSRRRAYRP